MIQHSRSRSLIASLMIALLTAGCALPGSKDQSLAGQIDATRAVRTASYETPSSTRPSSKKVSDPVTLKLHFAKWMEEMENFTEAQTHYYDVLQQRPQDIDAILGLARIDQAAGRKAEAEAGFNQALSLQPQSPVAQHSLGQYYASQKRWQESLRLFSDAMMGDSTNKVYRYDLAVALAYSGDVSAAHPHFRQAVGEVAAHYNVGMILKEQGAYGQAEQQFLQALTKNPNFQPAMQELRNVRQQAQAVETYATQRRPVPQVQPATPQVRPASHQQLPALSSAQQEQLRNQRPLPQ